MICGKSPAQAADSKKEQRARSSGIPKTPEAFLCSLRPKSCQTLVSREKEHAKLPPGLRHFIQGTM